MGDFLSSQRKLQMFEFAVLLENTKIGIDIFEKLPVFIRNTTDLVKRFYMEIRCKKFLVHKSNFFRIQNFGKEKYD